MSTTDQYISLQSNYDTRTRFRLPDKTALRVTSVPVQEPIASTHLTFGWDQNGQPVSLDPYNPAYGPLLVAGEAGCGKTALLRSLADAAGSLLDVQFGILTPFPEQWQRQETLPGCMGVFSVEHASVADYLARLVSLAQVLPRTRQAILLFVDGLDRMLLEPAALQSFHWLLAHGPTARVLPLVSADTRRIACILPFMKYFQARILGHVNDDHWMRFLSGDAHMDLASLQPGIQFQWIRPQGNLLFSVQSPVGV